MVLHPAPRGRIHFGVIAASFSLLTAVTGCNAFGNPDKRLEPISVQDLTTFRQAVNNALPGFSEGGPSANDAAFKSLVINTLPLYAVSLGEGERTITGADLEQAYAILKKSQGLWLSTPTSALGDYAPSEQVARLGFDPVNWSRKSVEEDLVARRKDLVSTIVSAQPQPQPNNRINQANAVLHGEDNILKALAVVESIWIDAAAASQLRRNIVGPDQPEPNGSHTVATLAHIRGLLFKAPPEALIASEALSKSIRVRVSSLRESQGLLGQFEDLAHLAESLEQAPHVQGALLEAASQGRAEVMETVDESAASPRKTRRALMLPVWDSIRTSLVQNRLPLKKSFEVTQALRDIHFGTFAPADLELAEHAWLVPQNWAIPTSSARAPKSKLSTGIVDPRTGITFRLIGFSTTDPRVSPPAFLPSSSADLGAAMQLEPQSKLYAVYLAQNEITVECWEGYIEQAAGHASDSCEAHWTVNDLGQWLISDDSSFHSPRAGFNNERDGNLPATQICWNSAAEFCDYFGYRVPSTASWHHAASLPHSRLRPPASGRYANFADGTLISTLGGSARPLDTYKLEDGHAFLAPVGSFRPNRFGIHDLWGNVWEWCREDSTPISGEMPIRGGGWLSGPTHSASYLSENFPTSQCAPNLGLRPLFSCPVASLVAH